MGRSIAHRPIIISTRIAGNGIGGICVAATLDGSNLSNAASAIKHSGRLSRNARPTEKEATGSEIERILDLARWAPSGDNSQPWRFKIVGEDKLIVDIRVEGEKLNIYDYADGRPTLLSAGFLLETISIAASRFGRAMQWAYHGSNNCESDGTHHQIEVTLRRDDDALGEDPLYPYVAIRSVDRRAYRTIPLTAEQKATLKCAVGEEFDIQWFETFSERSRTAWLNARATDIRLRLHEAYVVHDRIIDWDHPFSRDGVPAKAIGFDPITLRLMRLGDGQLGSCKHDEPRIGNRSSADAA